MTIESQKTPDFDRNFEGEKPEKLVFKVKKNLKLSLATMAKKLLIPASS